MKNVNTPIREARDEFATYRSFIATTNYTTNLHEPKEGVPTLTVKDIVRARTQHYENRLGLVATLTKEMEKQKRKNASKAASKLAGKQTKREATQGLSF